MDAVRLAPGQPLPPSLWAATAFLGPPLQPLQGTQRTDVLVIGGGYTGLSTALHLAEAGVDVCLLEAHQLGWGASGRNGGQVNPTLKYDPDELERLFGPARAEPLIAAISSAADLVFDLIARHGIDCAPVRQGWLQVSYSAKGVPGLHARARKWQARGVPADCLDAEALQSRMGTTAFAGGWRDGRAGGIQPLSYVRGLAWAAQAAGAHLHDRSPVTGLLSRDGRWQASLADGSSVSAEQVVIATNGYTGALWPGLERTILAANSFIVATEPLTGEAAASILPGGETASTAQRLLLYLRRDAEGRLLMGGRGHFDDPQGAGDFAHLERSLELLFPQLGKPRYSHRWAGRIAITRDFLPHLHEPAPGITLALGCNGRGIALCTSLGRHLANRLTNTGAAFPYPLSPLSPIPLHRLQRFYIGAGVAWYSLLDRIGS